ncbi:MAG TPA: hypothetical protein PL048_05865 [Leptospiraceae bacterium]|nr:hypothetical protein [Leptospiraceae bacterium]HMY66071.1 hypothetical protein [Leptospiraceae bacterium]HMZ58279.1 hypothetical protein [Leptospiraceae bacterium]HNF16456.1 hypothetical protein [Leptospiraceae bacterium]HNF27379.1 hypothetical protein [Leptospiraceae bacterium]
MEDGIKELVNEGMNETSAQYYINAYVAMRNGTRYDMTIKIYATDYFLKNILADLGKAGLEKALDSVQSHLEYQENSLFNKQKTIRDIYDEYSKKLL